MLSHLLLFSELLHFNGPHRDRPLLANRDENEDCNEDDNQDDENNEEEKQSLVKKGAVMVHCSSSIEEHIIEHLPPTLHKGTRGFISQLLSLPCSKRHLSTGQEKQPLLWLCESKQVSRFSKNQWLP